MKTGILACAALAMTIAGAQAAPQRDEKVYAAVAANRAGALDLLKQIVNIDSGTGDVAGGAKVAAYSGTGSRRWARRSVRKNPKSPTFRTISLRYSTARAREKS
jgi:hypothetical protein